MQAELARNFFELFGLPMQFDLDTAALASLYETCNAAITPIVLPPPASRSAGSPCRLPRTSMRPTRRCAIR
jgi:hypothetical protein